MGINVIEYAELWSTVLDQQITQVATSGWMEANAGQVQYMGGKKVRIPELYVTGLGDYSRGTGASNRGKYAKGAVEVKYRDYELTQDRSAEFAWDRHDVDESGYIVQAPTVMGEFQRTQVIPEIDSFRYSKIAQIVMADGTYTTDALTPDNIFSKFTAAVMAMQNVTGVDTGDMVLTMPYSVWGILEQSVVNKASISVQDFEQGGVNFRVKSINGIVVIPVVEDRMKTEYIFHSGDDDGEMGFEPAAGAKTINWILTPRRLPIAISKTDNLKIWTPDSNITGDDWLTQYRKYHDLWIMHNQLNQIVLSIAE